MPDDTNITEDEKFDRMITRILHEHAERTITDDQIKRVLAPIQARIAAGEFTSNTHTANSFPKHRPRPHRTVPRNR